MGDFIYERELKTVHKFITCWCWRVTIGVTLVLDSLRRFARHVWHVSRSSMPRFQRELSVIPQNWHLRCACSPCNIKDCPVEKHFWQIGQTKPFSGTSSSFRFAAAKGVIEGVASVAGGVGFAGGSSLALRWSKGREPRGMMGVMAFFNVTPSSADLVWTGKSESFSSLTVGERRRPLPPGEFK